jgi:hypothetical protein
MSKMRFDEVGHQKALVFEGGVAQSGPSGLQEKACRSPPHAFR